MEGAFGSGGPPNKGNGRGGGGKKPNNNFDSTFKDSDYRPFPKKTTKPAAA